VAGAVEFVLTVLAVGAAIAATVDVAYADPTVQVLAQGAASIDGVLTNIRNWLIGILVSVATVVCTIAGVRYVASNGDPGEVERAKAGLRAGAWGYAIAALAPVLVAVLKQIVGV
jgi:hypothetical protein